MAESSEGTRLRLSEGQQRVLDHSRGPLLVLLTSGLGIHYVVSNVISLLALTLVRYGLADTWIWAKAGREVMFSSLNLEQDRKLAASIGPNARAGTPQAAATLNGPGTPPSRAREIRSATSSACTIGMISLLSRGKTGTWFSTAAGSSPGTP